MTQDNRIPVVPLATIAPSFLEEEGASSNTYEWILNPTFRDTRTLVGRSFAGTATVAGEPCFGWILSNFPGATMAHREDLVRYIMSVFIAETIRKGGIVFARQHSTDGTRTTHSLASLVIVREFDAKREMSFWTKTVDAICDTVVTIRLAITDGMPALLTNKAFKQPAAIANRVGDTMVQSWQAAHVSLMPHKHWYIATVGTEPDLQGTGQGSAIMKRITQMADQARADCYLEANGTDNRQFYEKFGFIARGSYQVKNGWDLDQGETITTYYMIRRSVASLSD